MSFLDFLPVIGNILDKVIPDKAAAQKAKLELERLNLEGALKAQAAELEAIVALSGQQTEVNKVEAANRSVFIAGWRPFCGWVCGTALAWTFIGQPLVQFVAAVGGLDFDVKLIPAVDSGPLMTILLGMLGLGTMRTWEKVKGAENNR